MYSQISKKENAIQNKIINACFVLFCSIKFTLFSSSYSTNSYRYVICDILNTKISVLKFKITFYPIISTPLKSVAFVERKDKGYNRSFMGLSA